MLAWMQGVEPCCYCDSARAKLVELLKYAPPEKYLKLGVVTIEHSKELSP